MTHAEPLRELYVSKLTENSRQGLAVAGDYMLGRTAVAWEVKHEGQPLLVLGVERRVQINKPRVWLLTYETDLLSSVAVLRELRLLFRKLLALLPSFDCTIVTGDVVAARFASFFGLRHTGDIDGFHIYEV